jgi:hypothetical protein
VIELLAQIPKRKGSNPVSDKWKRETSSHTRFEYDVTNFAGLKEPKKTKKKDFLKLGLD